LHLPLFANNHPFPQPSKGRHTLHGKGSTASGPFAAATGVSRTGFFLAFFELVDTEIRQDCEIAR